MTAVEPAQPRGLSSRVWPSARGGYLARMPVTRVRTDRGLDRLVNFTDAVVAIAITFLVLPLVGLGTNPSGQSVIELLHDHFSQFAAFLFTFAVMTIFWISHHSLFERVGRYDGFLVWLNALWLLGIVLFPFASELINSYGFSNGAGVLYCGIMAMLALLKGMMVTHLRARPQMWSASTRYSDLQSGRFWVDAAYFTGAAVISIPAPRLAAFSMIGVFLIVYLRYRRTGL